MKATAIVGEDTPRLDPAHAGPSPEQAAEQRRRLARQACYEVEALGRTLIRESARDDSTFYFTARGIGARLVQLYAALILSSSTEAHHKTVDGRQALFDTAEDSEGDAA